MRRAPAGVSEPRAPFSWLLASLVGSLSVVAYASLPVLRNPQLEPDDFRYLHQVRELQEHFWANLVKVSVVANSWSHLWWIDVHQAVRFFRPTIVLSYLLDARIHGYASPLGLLTTNILIYAACVALACLLMYRWLACGPALFLSAMLFASFSCHGEVIWYVAGRTDSLAALFILLSLAFHLYGSDRRWLRWLAVPSFALGLVSKELALLVPPAIFLLDWLAADPPATAAGVLARDWALYFSYALVSIAVLSCRAIALSGSAAGYPFPYFVMPGQPEFLAHLWGQLNGYAANLLVAAPVIPMRDPTPLATPMTIGALVGVLTLLAIASYLLRRQRLYWIVLGLGVAAWGTTIVVYVSERYLFLPSFAVAVIVGLLLSNLHRTRRRSFCVAAILVSVWIGHQAYSLEAKDQNIAGNPRLPQRMGDELQHLKSSMTNSTKLLVLNLPGECIQAQFAEDQFRTQLDLPDLDVTVLTLMPLVADMADSLKAVRESEYSFVIDSSRSLPVLVRLDEPFPWVDLGSGSEYLSKNGIRVEIEDGNLTVARRLRVTLPEPLSHYTLMRWIPLSDRRHTLLYRRLRSQAEILNW
jgi:hypothetical protein